jgi:hypothetical protein
MIDITTREFLWYTNLSFEEAENKTARDISKLLMLENNKKDLEYVKQVKPCLIRQNILEHLDDIRESNLMELYGDQFYDIGFMKYLTDLTCPIFYPIGGQHNTTMVKTWLKNFRKFGEPSVEGIAIEGSITNKNEGLFVIKAPRDINDNLAHEAIVGYALAPLRASIPNFSWIYGVLRCSMPLLVDRDSKIASWCDDTSNPVTYVVYEKIPGVNFKKFIKTCSPEDFMNAYMQILYSLVMADNYCGFTHYDLHYENIIMRPLTEVSDIIYNDGNKKVVISTKNIATFIDYGFSRVEFDGRTSGKYGFESFSIFGDKSYVMFDAFKILCFSCATMISNSSPAKDTGLKLLKFFIGEEDPITFLLETGEKNKIMYSLPYQLGQDIYMHELIKYIDNSGLPLGFRKSLEDIFQGDNVLNCEYQNCMSSSTLDKILHIEDTEDFKDIRTYYVAMKNNVVSSEQRSKFKIRYKRELVREFYGELRTKLKEIDAELSTTAITMVFNNSAIAAINSKNQSILREYRKYVEHVIDIIAMYNDIVHDYDMLIEITDHLDLESEEIENARDEFVRSSKRSIMEYYDNLKLNMEFLRPLNLENNWYRKILPTYITSINITV